MNASSTTVKNRRKVLVPLATMMVAGAVAIGSGATFTSTSVSTTSVTAGILEHVNDQGGKTLRIDNIKPGDVRSGTLTITNDGTLDSTLSLRETTDSSTFEPGALHLEITDGASVLYAGDFGGLAERLDVGALPVDAVKTITFTVSMPKDAGDANQGKAASATYEYVTTQTGDNSSTGWF